MLFTCSGNPRCIRDKESNSLTEFILPSRKSKFFNSSKKFDIDYIAKRCGIYKYVSYC